MVLLDETNWGSRPNVPLRGGLASALPANPAGLFDAYYATDTEAWYLSTDGTTWDVEYPLGNLNTGVPDVRCRLFKTGTQSISAGGNVDVTWGGESYDTTGMHSTVSNTERITIATKGIYEIKCCIRMNTAFDNGSLRATLNHYDDSAALTVNIGSQSTYEPSGGTTPSVFVGAETELDVNDYITVNAFQNTSSSEDISVTGTFLSARLVKAT